MKAMSSRERVLAALNHEEPDRIPIDLGGTTASTIVVAAYENLKKYLGLQHKNKLRAARASTVIPDNSVLEYFKIDTRPLLLGDFTNTNSGRSSEGRFIDAWGTTWKKAPDGHYINVDGPFQSGDPSMASLETYDWPDPEDPSLYRGLKERAEQMGRATDCAIILNLPLGVVHQCQFVRGFSEWLLDLAASPEYALRMIDIISDLWIRIAQNSLDIVGHMVDVIEWGDDVAMQQGPLFSPNMYRQMIKPAHRKMMAALKSRSEARVVYHSCGSVATFIEDFIEIGVDALNPVQVSADNMDPIDLKENYGDRITFWGGIDTHHVLPGGTTTEVREEVQRITEIMGRGGGYVLAAVHNIQHDVPPQNVAAMLEAGLKYGQY